jgi:rubrerythrin
MEMHRMEGLWDCPSCGTNGIKARFDSCPNCGKVRGIETLFYLPDDTRAAILCEEEAAKTTNEPDWLCSYCGTYNRSTNETCHQCGGLHVHSKENYGTLNKLTGLLFRKK